MINFAEYFDDYSDKIDWKSIEASLASSIMEELDKNTNRIAGKIIPTDTTQSIVKKALKSFYSGKQYKSSLLKLVQNIEKKGGDYLGEYGKYNLRVNKPLSLAIDEHLSGLNENGLNERFNQPLRRIVLDNIRRGLGQNDIYKNLESYLKDDKTGFKKYGKNMAIQGASAYASIIDQSITDKYKSEIKGFTIVGSLIETSSEQCRHFVKIGRKLTIEEIKKEILPIAIENKNLPEDFDVYKLPSTKLHQGCRHSFIGYI